MVSDTKFEKFSTCILATWRKVLRLSFPSTAMVGIARTSKRRWISTRRMRVANPEGEVYTIGALRMTHGATIESILEHCTVATELQMAIYQEAIERRHADEELEAMMIELDEKLSDGMQSGSAFREATNHNFSNASVAISDLRARCNTIGNSVADFRKEVREQFDNVHRRISAISERLQKLEAAPVAEAAPATAAPVQGERCLTGFISKQGNAYVLRVGGAPHVYAADPGETPYHLLEALYGDSVPMPQPRR